MGDSWLSGMKKWKIPRPKMTTTTSSTSTSTTKTQRPADPPKDYLYDDGEDESPTPSGSMNDEHKKSSSEVVPANNNFP